jgi:hypothetical protein
VCGVDVGGFKARNEEQGRRVRRDESSPEMVRDVDVGTRGCQPTQGTEGLDTGPARVRRRWSETSFGSMTRDRRQ